MLSTVDTILMGGLSNLHLAAVGIGSMIFNIIYWNFGFLRMGTTGMTAQAYGAEETDHIWLSFLRPVLLSIVIGAGILLIQSYLYSVNVWGLNISDELNPLALQYFEIRIWAAPASLMLMVIMGWFFGMQNAIYPLILTVLINVSNIIVSYYLVTYANMDVRGVAWGTLIAQYIGTFAGLGLIMFRYRSVIQMNLLSKLKELSSYKKFFQVNGNLFLRTICLTFAFGFFYSQSSKLSDTVLAVNVVLMQFVNWMSYGIDGFAYATESLVGRFKGAKDIASLKQTIRQSFIWGGGVSVIYTLIYTLFGQDLFSLFSNDVSLYKVGKELLWYMAIFPLVSFASYIWDGIFVGLTATRSMRNAMLGALIVFLIAFYALPSFPNGQNIWIAMCVLMIARASFQYLYYKKYGVELM